MSRFLPVNGLFAGIGVVFFAVAAVVESISADTVLPLFTLAAGVAVGTVYVLRSPAKAERQGQMEAADDIIKWLRASLEGEVAAHEKTLKKLGKARAIIADHSLDLEEIDASDPDLPKLTGDKGHAQDPPRPEG